MVGAVFFRHQEAFIGITREGVRGTARGTWPLGRPLGCIHAATVRLNGVANP